jgi:hypothetical protein
MATADDGPGGLERDLIERADYVARWSSDHTTAARLRKAADVIAGQRRAIEASRVWWDDNDPYHAAWDHSSTCWPGRECGACVARRLALAALGETGGGT